MYEYMCIHDFVTYVYVYISNRPEKYIHNCWGFYIISLIGTGRDCRHRSSLKRICNCMPGDSSLHSADKDMEPEEGPVVDYLDPQSM